MCSQSSNPCEVHMTLFMHNTKLEEVMRLHQQGEVMLVVMVVMMAVGGDEHG